MSLDQNFDFDFTVLVVDDNPLELGLIRLVIKKTFPDIKFIGLTKPPNWCISLKENEPDLIIIDYRLPERNGLEEIKEIRKYDTDIHTYLITALERDEIDQDITKAGVNDLIIKDRNYSNLIIRLNSLMVQKSAKHLQDELKLLNYILDQILDKVLLQIDVDKNCKRVFGCVDKIFGLNKEDLLGQNWLKFFKCFYNRDLKSEFNSQEKVEKKVVKIDFEKSGEVKFFDGLELITKNYLFIVI